MLYTDVIYFLEITVLTYISRVLRALPIIVELFLYYFVLNILLSLDSQYRSYLYWGYHYTY